VIGRHRKKHGSVIDVENTRSEVLFDGGIGDIVTAVDVTGRFSGPVAAASPKSEGRSREVRREAQLPKDDGLIAHRR
jgi:hypothetical protein